MVDLSVYILPSPLAPVANFAGTPLSISTGGVVSFTDLSANTPTSWSWSFTGGSPSTSTLQNPTGITYPAAGCYQVSLTATNAIGSDAEVKTCYITVGSASSPPVANFSASATSISTGGSTNFTDLTTNSPTSWSWSFTGGTPATSTLQNPTGITYPTAGCYQVTLTATNSSGSDAEVKTCYINVTSGTSTYCSITTSTYGTTDGDFIDGVTLGTINNLNTGSATGPFYMNYTAMSTNLAQSSAQTIAIKSGTWPATYPDYYAAWIDYNHDNDFADTGEKLGEFLSSAPSTTQSIAFTVPATATTGNTRMRVRCAWSTTPGLDPCLSYAYGETEDYTVNITTTGGGGGGSVCDTLKNYDYTDNIVLYTNTGGGYVCGHNSYNDLAKVEKFTTYTAGYKVKGAYLDFAKAKYSTTAKTISVKIWDDNGTAGAPNTVLATKTVTIASIAPDVLAGNSTYVQFTSPVTVTGPFYLGIEFAYASGDTVALWSNSDGETSPGTAWEKFSDGAWHAMSETATWGINISQLIRPLMCSPSTEAEEIYSGLGFNVYPNPNSGEFTIEISSTETAAVTYTIINSVGKEIIKKEIRSVGGNQTEQISLGDLASGIYYVIMQSGENVINKKVVIQK
jgi:PKD repeat protein